MNQQSEKGILKILLRLATISALLLSSIAIASVCIPIYIIRPFRPQTSSGLALALWLREVGPQVTLLTAVLIFVFSFLLWTKINSRRLRVALLCIALLVTGFAALSRVNIFERMFHRYNQHSLIAPNSIRPDSDDLVLAVKFNGQARAYPIRMVGYHHIINDVIGGVAVVVTYCTLCHTGIIWDPIVSGQKLNFRLAGINNGNALLRDEQTGSIWQQSTGEAIFGPLVGTHLKSFNSNELTYALWREEEPFGEVISPDLDDLPRYEKKDWEDSIERTRVVVDTIESGIAPHVLMLGVSLGLSKKAYPIKAVMASGLIQDKIAGTPVLIVVGPDGKSIRTFEAGELSFAKRSGGYSMQDLQSSSRWNFQGCAVEGKSAGRCLKEIEAHKAYWFDWFHHYPQTGVYRW